MRRAVRARVELVLAVMSAVLALVTAVWPTWIESLFGVSPDGGSGETEWWLVLAVVAAVATVLAQRDLQALRRASDP